MVGEAERITKATDQRATEIYRLRTQEGLTLRAIGQRYDISPERVRQIIKAYCYAAGRPYPGGRVKGRQ